MSPAPAYFGDEVVLEPQGLQQLLEILQRQGYQLVGPTLRQGSLVYGPLSAAADLPRGWGDAQEGGVFRLRQLKDPVFFGYGVGQQSWKQFLVPPRRRLWRARQEEDGFKILPPEEDQDKFAFIGVHACDLEAILVQDQVFLNGPFVDPLYRARREQAFILAANCGHPCHTGFCASMGSGPRVTRGFDLALTEILQGPRHYLVLSPGTARGQQLIDQVPHQKAQPEEREAAVQLTVQTTRQLGRTLDTADLKALLYRN